MKNLITALAILLSTSAVAQPDKDWWACQYLESAGLQWKNGQWGVGRFQLESPFVLMSDGNGSLTEDSVSKPIKAPVSLVECVDLQGGDIGCYDASGGYLFFNTNTGRGGVSQMNGATSTSDNRDTVSVQAFECTKG